MVENGGPGMGMTPEQRKQANAMLAVVGRRDKLESDIKLWIDQHPQDWVERLNGILRTHDDEKTQLDQMVINSFVLFGAMTIINGFREEIVEGWREGRDPTHPSGDGNEISDW